MLDFLDDPRKSLWNIGSGLAEGDFSKALPGLLGAGAAGLTAATGFGLPFAALAGSAVGGLSQNLFGKEAQSPDDLVRGMGGDPESVSGQIGSLATGILGDPLSLAGVGMGARAGSKIGGAAGRSLEVGAIQRGPRYGTTVDDLLKTMPTKTADMTPEAIGILERSERVKPVLNEFKDDPQFKRMLQEIPEGSQYIDGGAYGSAYRTPTGDVSRIGFSEKAQGRPISDMVVQPTRSVSVPAGVDSGTSPLVWTAERTPFAENVNKPAELMGKEFLANSDLPLKEKWNTWVQKLKEEARQKKMDFWDDHPGNVGIQGGRPKVIDPGAIVPRAFYDAGFNPMIDVSKQPGMLSTAILKMMGSDQAMQAALAQRRNSVSFAPQLERMGATGGAALGFGSNAFLRGNQ